MRLALPKRLLQALYRVGGGFGVALATVAMHADAAPTKTSLAAALTTGRPFVLVVAPPANADLAQSEAFDDWKAQLRAFEQRKPPGIEIVMVNRARYAKSFARPVMVQDFGTVFVRDRRRALVHQGKILDPFLYDCGTNYLRRRPSCPEAANYGMPEVTVRRR